MNATGSTAFILANAGLAKENGEMRDKCADLERHLRALLEEYWTVRRVVDLISSRLNGELVESPQSAVEKAARQYLDSIAGPKGKEMANGCCRKCGTQVVPFSPLIFGYCLPCFRVSEFVVKG